MKFLLDANVAIALTDESHLDHEAALSWLHGNNDTLLCPVVEGALFRYMIRAGKTADDAVSVLNMVEGNERVRLIDDDLHYGDGNWTGLRGHRQVTDMYLVELTARHGAQLATFDEGIATARPEQVHLIGS